MIDPADSTVVPDSGDSGSPSRPDHGGSDPSSEAVGLSGSVGPLPAEGMHCPRCHADLTRLVRGGSFCPRCGLSLGGVMEWESPGPLPVLPLAAQPGRTAAIASSRLAEGARAWCRAWLGLRHGPLHAAASDMPSPEDCH